MCKQVLKSHPLKQEGAAWLINDGWVRIWAGLRVVAEGQTFVDTALDPDLSLDTKKKKVPI